MVGTTGESATLDVSEHVQLIERAVDISNGRIKVIAGTGANSTKEAIYLILQPNLQVLMLHFWLQL